MLSIPTPNQVVRYPCLQISNGPLFLLEKYVNDDELGFGLGREWSGGNHSTLILHYSISKRDLHIQE